MVKCRPETSAPKEELYFLGAMIRILSTLAVLAFSETAMSCMVPPPMLYRDHAALVNEATTVLVVEVISGSASLKNTCQFRVVITLKGSVPEKIPVTCSLPDAESWMTHFSGHSDLEFWQQRSGRLGIKSDCTLIPPTFEVGHYYLVLLGGTADTKQFEEITGPYDQWFVFVKKQILGSKR